MDLNQKKTGMNFLEMTQCVNDCYNTLMTRLFESIDTFAHKKTQLITVAPEENLAGTLDNI